MGIGSLEEIGLRELAAICEPLPRMHGSRLPPCMHARSRQVHVAVIARRRRDDREPRSGRQEQEAAEAEAWSRGRESEQSPKTGTKLRPGRDVHGRAGVPGLIGAEFGTVLGSRAGTKAVQGASVEGRDDALEGEPEAGRGPDSDSLEAAGKKLTVFMRGLGMEPREEIGVGSSKGRRKLGVGSSKGRSRRD